MESVVLPTLVYLGIVLGAVGVAVALPRKGVNPQLVGGIVAGGGLGLAFLALILAGFGVGSAPGDADAGTGSGLPSPFIYVFSAIALASALRVITHQKPVYSALYFILTILSSSSLYLMVGAEFLGFALLIIYAGAILITYLFVIMLATQAPTEEAAEALSPYDAVAREPIMSTALGFTLLAVLTGVFAQGVVGGIHTPNTKDDRLLLTQMPKSVVDAYDKLGVFPALEEPTLSEIRLGLGGTEEQPGIQMLDPIEREMTFFIADQAAWEEVRDLPRVAELLIGPPEPDFIRTLATQNFGEGKPTITLALPPKLGVDNAQAVGFALIADHPIALELAGVILLMAMLGAVVLARKQIEIGEEEKERAAGVPGDDNGPNSPNDRSSHDSTGSPVQRGRHVMVSDAPGGGA